ncbi:MAG: hypothetical protein Q8P13_03840 [bacterium]|nr:hypothetical protein [bacterium]
MATLIQSPLKATSSFSLKRVTLAVVAVAIILALVVAGAWYYLDQQSKNPNTTNTPINTASNSAKQASSSAEKILPSTKTVERIIKLYDSLFDHSTKKGKTHMLTFKAPETWLLKEDDSKNENSGHYYTITGSNGFLIEISEIPGGIGGACPEDTKPPANLIVSSEKIKVNNQNLYLRFTGSSSENQVKTSYLASSKEWSCVLDNVIPLKTKDPTGPVNFSFEMSFKETISKQEFVNSLEYKAAKELLQSLVVED